jgi:acyl-CoA synthetase (AMP-forming)/AMP-acid ligase II
VELLEYFQRVMPDCVLFNLYGTSEVWDVTWYDPREHSGASLRRVPIGRPISNMQVYVLDPHLQPVPVGVTGELFVGGVGLARGYLNRPELTAEKFIPHPFRDEPGACLYRTGDLVRYLPDGNLEFIGRIDHLVKLRGFRIELGEVEAVLNQHENVRQAAVIAHEVQPGDQRLIAYLVPQMDVKLSAADLRAFLREKLPEHMLPGAFEFLDSLPLTPSGKVNRTPTWLGV